MNIRFPTERTPRSLVRFVLILAAVLTLLLGIVLLVVAWTIEGENALRNTLLTLSGFSGATALLTFAGLWFARKCDAR
jgi:hypothetical protein